MKCEHCGGEMRPGVPGDVYCPKSECFEKDQKRAWDFVRRRVESEERAALARLKAKYEADAP